ncbi:hypothetical protein RHS02_05143, partial [Rhizoctonia solani]
MGLASTNSDTNGPIPRSGTNQSATTVRVSTPNILPYTSSALGLLHDDKFGNHPTESKDIAILRRLKLAILEGQHPYFKANIDLSNLQDLVLNSGSRPVGPPFNQSIVLEPTVPQSSGHKRRNAPPALDDLGTSGPTILDYGNEDSNGKSQVNADKTTQSNATSAHPEDVNMANPEGSGDSSPPHEDPGSENRQPPTQTLGRYVLHSPILSESANQMAHQRRLSDTPTLVDSNDQATEPEVHVKRESPPHQLSGSQSQALDPSSSSMASFVSNSTASTGLTSDDGVVAEGTQSVDADLAGYDPKYGNKADYIRRQKVRSKAIESIEERTRRAGHRQDDKQDDKVGQKSPARSANVGNHQVNGPNVSPIRGRDPSSRAYHATSISDSNAQGNSDTISQRTPLMDAPPPLDFQTSPRGRQPAPSFKPLSPASGKIQRPRKDSIPPREYRPQYIPYDDPRSARPRPIVSSPPRGSPPRETSMPRAAVQRTTHDEFEGLGNHSSTTLPRTETRTTQRTTHDELEDLDNHNSTTFSRSKARALRQATLDEMEGLDNYSSATLPRSKIRTAQQTYDEFDMDNYNAYTMPRTETRSFDLRPSSPIFSEGMRATGSYSMGSDTSRSGRAPSRALHTQPSRGSPPPPIRDRTPFGSSTLPANPSTGYRPEGLPDPPSARYNPYDTTSRRVDWASRDWERSADSKPKLQDRFNMDPQWHDSLESRMFNSHAARPLRDEFTHPTGDYASRYRREPSPGAPRYADGFRSGFSRPVEVEGIRPMKRSRPDDTYPPRGAGMEPNPISMDERTGYYRRKPPPRADDEYEPRPRPPY